MSNCNKKRFVTAFPNGNPVNLCEQHFMSEMGHLIDRDAPITFKDMTSDPVTFYDGGDRKLLCYRCGFEKGHSKTCENRKES